MQQRDRLGGVEVEVVPDRPVTPRAGRDPLAGFGVTVVAQGFELVPGDESGQPEPIGQLAPLDARQLLVLGVVIGPAVITFGPARVIRWIDSQHRPSVPHKGCRSVNGASVPPSSDTCLRNRGIFPNGSDRPARSFQVSARNGAWLTAP